MWNMNGEEIILFPSPYNFPRALSLSALSVFMYVSLLSSFYIKLYITTVVMIVIKIDAIVNN